MTSDGANHQFDGLFDDEDDNSTRGEGQVRLDLPSLATASSAYRSYYNAAERKLASGEEVIPLLAGSGDPDVDSEAIVIGSLEAPQVADLESQMEHLRLMDASHRETLSADIREHIMNYESEAKSRVWKLQEEYHRDDTKNESLREEEETLRRDLVLKEYARLDDRLRTALESAGADIVSHETASVESSDGQALWRIDWKHTPHPIQLRVVAARCVGEKLPKGKYVMLVSIYDRLAGSVLRYSKLQGAKWAGATNSVHHGGQFFDSNLVFDESVHLVLPANVDVGPSTTLVFELFLLRSGRRRPHDVVVAWGIFPAVNGRFQVLQGRFRTPLIRGEVDMSVTQYSRFESLYRNDPDVFVGNLFFEILLRNKFLPSHVEFECGVLFQRSFGRSDEEEAARIRALSKSLVDPAQTMSHEDILRFQPSTKEYIKKATGLVTANERQGHKGSQSNRWLRSALTATDESTTGAPAIVDTNAADHLTTHVDSILVPRLSASRRSSHNSAFGASAPSGELLLDNIASTSSGREAASRTDMTRQLLEVPSQVPGSMESPSAQQAQEQRVREFSRSILPADLVDRDEDDVAEEPAEGQNASPAAAAAAAASASELPQKSGLTRRRRANSSERGWTSLLLRREWADSVHRSHAESQNLALHGTDSNHAANGNTGNVLNGGGSMTGSAGSAGRLGRPTAATVATELDLYKVSVAPAERTWNQTTISAEKVTYIRRALIQDLGLHDHHRLEFYVMVFLLLLLAWLRLFPHFFGTWLYLQAFRTPVSQTDILPYTWQFHYQGEFFSAGFEVGSTVSGTLFNMVLFTLMMFTVAGSQLLLGRFPDFGSRIVFAFGAAVVLDPLLIVFVDCATADTTYGEFFRMERYYSTTENNGAVGIVLTIFLYVQMMVMSSFLMYHYVIRLHMNGRMMDVYYRLHGKEGNFFLPHDAEISLSRFKDLAEKARHWRGQDGALRKIVVKHYEAHMPDEVLERLYNLASAESIDMYLQQLRIDKTLELRPEIKRYARREFPTFVRAEYYNSITVDDMRNILRDYYRQLARTEGIARPVSWMADGDRLLVHNDHILVQLIDLEDEFQFDEFDRIPDAVRERFWKKMDETWQFAFDAASKVLRRKEPLVFCRQQRVESLQSSTDRRQNVHKVDHVGIITVGSDGSRELFRHFVRGPDGVFAEVFDSEEESRRAVMSRSSPRSVDYWICIAQERVHEMLSLSTVIQS